MSQESGNWRLDVSVEPFPSRLVFMQYLSIKKTAFLFLIQLFLLFYKTIAVYLFHSIIGN